MKRKNKWLVTASAAGLMLLLFFSPGAVKAQTTAPSDEEDPEWVDMMNDPNVNYFEAVSSYNEWANERDEEQGDEDGAEQEDEHDVMARSFVRWMNNMYPFVQADGSILPEKEREKIMRRIKH